MNKVDNVIIIDKYDSGDIVRDIFDTVSNYSKKEMSNFIKSICLKKDDGNIVGHYILFRYEECDRILKSIKNINELSFADRKRLRKGTYRLDTELLLTSIYSNKKTPNELVNLLIPLVVDRIDFIKMFSNVLANDKYDINFYKRCFQILEDDNEFEMFLEYDKNLEHFGTNYTPYEYVIEISKLFSNGDKDVDKNNDIFKYKFITYRMIDRYLKLRKKYNVDIPVLHYSFFKQEGKRELDKLQQVKIDNSWNINPELREYIFSDINNEYNILEKISYIYLKLCLALRYNLNYYMKTWPTSFNKERQEAINLSNNEVICSEFSYICTKLISELSEDIDVRCVVEGKDQHMFFSVMIEKENLLVNFDSTKVVDEFDDLTRIKIGYPLVGVKYVSDRENKFTKAFDRVYNDFCLNNQIETENLINIYEQLEQNSRISIDFLDNMQEFLEIVRKRNILGCELIEIFKLFHKIKFFGDIEYAIVGYDKKMTFKDRRLYTTAEEITDGLEEEVIIKNGEDYFLLELNTRKFVEMSLDELNYLFDEDKLAYFNPKHRIEGIGVKRCK